MTGPVGTDPLSKRLCLRDKRNGEGMNSVESVALFRTAAWTENWWREWGGSTETNRSGQLYLARYRWRGLPIRSAQFIGTDHRKLSTPRAEYLSLTPGIEGRELAVLDSSRWTEAVFRDLIANGSTERAIREWARERGYLLRTVHEDVAYQVDTRGKFEIYLNNLGKNTRLKLYNRRRRLAQKGEISVAYWQPGPFLELLNGFHRQRWGGPCFNQRSLRFHRRFLEDVIDEGGQPALEVLSLEGRPLSALYNVVYRDRVYNIQSGFQEHPVKGVALGTLHLGYALEQAFLDPAIGCFDLLAGQGKNTDYKAHLATDKTPLISLMVVRHKFYRFLYTALDLLNRTK